MSKAKRVFSKEFKQEAVRLILERSKSVEQLSRELGIRANTLHRWKKEQSEESEEAFRGHGNRTAEGEELRQLRQEVEQLRQEREILKKALGMFTRPAN